MKVEAHLRQKLRDLGLLRQLAEGGSGVRVSLQIADSLPALPRAKRREWLAGRFDAVAKLRSGEVELDLDSISPSAQTVEALIPLAQYDEIEAELKRHGIRVDPLLDRQVHNG